MGEEVKDPLSEDTSIKVQRRTSSMLQTAKRQLGYPSLDAILLDFVRVIGKLDRLEIECLMKFGKVPTVTIGTAASDKELHKKVGVRGDMRKTSEFTETGPPIQGEVKRENEKGDAEK